MGTDCALFCSSNAAFELVRRYRKEIIDVIESGKVCPLPLPFADAHCAMRHTYTHT
jgi:hypothetical protein